MRALSSIYELELCYRCGKAANHNAFWGGYVSEGIIRKLLPHQRINHFPGSMQLGRKDYCWKNLSVLRRSFPEEYDLCAKTYLLPKDRDILERDWEELGKNAIFIVKPPGSSCGRGVRLAVDGCILTCFLSACFTDEHRADSKEEEACSTEIPW